MAHKERLGDRMMFVVEPLESDEQISVWHHASSSIMRRTSSLRNCSPPELNNSPLIRTSLGRGCCAGFILFKTTTSELYFSIARMSPGLNGNTARRRWSTVVVILGIIPQRKWFHKSLMSVSRAHDLEEKSLAEATGYSLHMRPANG
jgi:hypothetical protein